MRAERLQRLHELFRTGVTRSYPFAYGESETMLQCLFLDRWYGGSRDLWNHFKDGGPRNHTPLSNHLYEDVFLHWAEPFFGSMFVFEEAFGLFELLASISFLDEVDKAQLQAALNPGAQELPVAVGRTWRHHTLQKRVLARISSAPQLSSLLDAGFAKGDPRFLEMAIEYCQRVASGFR